MEKTLALILVAALALGGCTTSTEYGECIGAFDKKDPKLTYKLSGWNAFIAVMGASFFFIPTIVVVADSTFCPTGKAK